MNYNTTILKPTRGSIALAAAEIKSGGLVAFATETVYGLGADAFCDGAVKKIFDVKGRPSDNPLILHFADHEAMQTAGYFDERALAAARAFMPGPLTVVVKKKPHVPDIVTGGLDTVAVRIPSARPALQLIRECGVPIAAPSANASGSPSPTTARHVFDDLKGKIRYILDGGATAVGLESTIVDFSGENPRILRLGGVSLSRLKKVIGGVDVYKLKGGRPLCPGMSYRHYAPLARVEVFESLDGLKEGIIAADLRGIKTLVLAINPDGNEKIDGPFSFIDCGTTKNNIEIVGFKNEREYASGLYDRLRYADKSGCGLVLCLLTKGRGIGQAVNNRLLRAAGIE